MSFKISEVQIYTRTYINALYSLFIICNNFRVAIFKYSIEFLYLHIHMYILIHTYIYVYAGTEYIYIHIHTHVFTNLLPITTCVSPASGVYCAAAAGEVDF